MWAEAGGGATAALLAIDNTIGWWNRVTKGGDINEPYTYVTMKDNLLNKGAYLKWSKNKLYS